MLSFTSSHEKWRKYHELKAEIRSGVKAVTQEAATQTQEPDIEKLKEEIRKEVKKEFQKKVNQLTAVSKSRFERMSSGFELYISRTKHTN